MKKGIGLLIISIVMLSCNFVNNNEQVYKDPVMYQPTEMALLMRKMYEVNKVVKTQIINKDSLLTFPVEFSRIHTAVLTNPSERDKDFDSLAKVFIDHQKAIFSSNSDSIVFYFNRSVNTCITCHETRCVGPIPKIKKLLIH